ncbi:MAG: Do family serine endopeptidase [Bdellovibrionota bacterium]
MKSQQLFSLVLVLGMTACSQDGLKLPDSWKKESPKSSSSVWDKKPEKKDGNSLVPWKGGAIAADTFIKISQKADAGVVNIGTTKIIKQRQSPFGFGPSPFEDFFGDDVFKHFFGNPRQQQQPKEFKQQSLGSGFIISEDGLIVTNNHVIDQADEIKVTIGKDHEYVAKVIGADPKTDVALIKIDPKGEKLQALALGDSSDLQVGEIVVAIGNPFGLSHTVTQGIVSAKERAIGFGLYDNFIQTDASINPGNSGGPLLNLNAEVVGINTAIHASGQGIGFAIPINLARDILRQLENNGEVIRGWMGVEMQNMDEDLAKALGLEKPTGALIARVLPDSPAEKAKIMRGDVVLEVDGKTVDKTTDLPKIVAEIPVNKVVDVVVLRNGNKKTLSIKIGKRDDDQLEKDLSQEPKGSAKGPDKLGLQVGPITAGDRANMELDESISGVVVEDVDPNGPLASKQIQPGFIILEAKFGNKEPKQTKIKSVEDYQARVNALTKGSHPIILLLQTAPGQTLFVAFTVKIDG